MRKLLFASLMLLGTFAAVEMSTPPAHAIDCSTVRCMACPAGYVFSPNPQNCCRCLPK